MTQPSTMQPATQPAMQPATQPATQPAAQPVMQPVQYEPATGAAVPLTQPATSTIQPAAQDPSAGVVQPVQNTVPALVIDMPATTPQTAPLVQPQYDSESGEPLQLSVPAVNLQVPEATVEPVATPLPLTDEPAAAPAGAYGPGFAEAPSMPSMEVAPLPGALGCPEGFHLQYQRISCKVLAFQNSLDKHIDVGIYTDSECRNPVTISRAPAEYGAMGMCSDSRFIYQSAGGKVMSGGQYPPYVFGSCIDSAVMWQGHAEAGCVSDITVEVYISNACDPFCSPDGHSDPVVNNASASVCYDANEQEIEGCTCFDTCSKCGYSDDPTHALDCLQCKDGLELTVLGAGNTGTCTPTHGRPCYSEVGGEPIEDCTCHESCGSCGYGPSPTTANDCLSCLDQLTIFKIYPNGTGMCLARPIDEPAPNSGCYWWPEHYFDHNLDGHSVIPHAPHPPLSNCRCHHTCADCGYAMDYSTQKITSDHQPIPDDPAAVAMVNDNPHACLTCKAPLVLADSDPYHQNGATGRCVPEGLCINPHTRDAVPNCFCHPSCVECLGPGIDQCTSCAFKQLLVQAHLTPDDRGYKQPDSRAMVQPGRHGVAQAGQCVTPGYCYYDAMNHPNRTFPQLVDDCECHPSCSSCGYVVNDGSEGFTLPPLDGSPVHVHDTGHLPSGPDNCVTCHPGRYLTAINLNGHGYCSATQCQMFCVTIPVSMTWAGGIELTVGWIPIAAAAATALVGVALGMGRAVRVSRADRADKQMRLPLKDGRRGVHSYGAMDEGTRTPSDGGIPAYPVSP